MLTIPQRKKAVNLNAVYGLEYRSVAVKREDVDRLENLKQQTGQPITALVSMAITLFLKQAKPEETVSSSL